MLNIVVMNGGRGAATLIPALLEVPGVRLTSIVNAYDDGKSTGEIRRFFRMLGPSDLRKVQALMLPDDADRPVASALFAYRFADGTRRDDAIAILDAFCQGGDGIGGTGPMPAAMAATLRVFLRHFRDALPVSEAVLGRRFEFGDCALMNCIYAGAFLACGRDMAETVAAIDRLFRLRGQVLPNSGDNRWLAAERENGDLLTSEADIVELRSNERIAKLFLLEQQVDPTALERATVADRVRYLAQHHSPVRISAGVRLAIEQADIIVYAAGTQHSSLYPTYMSRGLTAAIVANDHALKVFVTNIGADYEAPRYRTSDFLLGALRFLTLGEARRFAVSDLIHATLINNSRIKRDETYVDDDAPSFADIPVERVVADLESREAPGRHDGAKITRLILGLFERRDRARLHAVA